MTRSIRAGDYVRFTRVVDPKVTASAKSANGTRFTHVVRAERIVQQSGSGLVTSVGKRARKVGDAKVLTGRVDAGPVLGIVTAVLDDAVLVGVQQQMFETAGPVQDSATMYDGGDHA